jgi:UDP-N-acetylglucosamine 3-dehydrogenase
MIFARRCHPRSVVRGRSWLNDEETGGVLNYAGTHNIDLICWYMGGAPERVYGEMGQLILEGQDFTDCAVMTFLFPEGGIAALYETFAYPANYPHGVDRSLEILGDGGVIKIDLMSQPLTVHTAEGYSLADSVTWPQSARGLDGALRAEVEHFLGCIREGRDPMTGAEEGKLAISIASAARRASESGRSVRI